MRRSVQEEAWTNMGGPAATDLLFVYGTLRKGGLNINAARLSRESRYIGEGYVRGLLHKIGDYPALIPDATAGWVIGDLVQLYQLHFTLDWLDAYEECSAEFPEPWEYERRVTTVETATGPALAWAYHYNWPTAKRPLISSGDWMTEINPD